MLLACLLSVAVAAAPAPALNPQHPERYVVVKGDTLWEVAGRFLREPWRWQEVWKSNPQIKNPDLIYPGDVIVLGYNNGSPELRLERDGGATAESGARGATVKLSPQVRSESREQAIPTVPFNTIQPFLTNARVVQADELERAPYIVASADEHLVGAAGNKVYARGLATPTDADHETGQRFSIVRLGEAYRNPPATRGTGSATDKEAEILGYEAIYVGEAKVEKFGDPATLIITRSQREVLNGDRLVPLGSHEIERHFIPRSPGAPVDARIISVLDGVTRIGQFQVVALNKGSKDGMEVGHVLAVHQHGDRVADTQSAVRGDTVQLPGERVGVLMVVRAFERVSYALVMEAHGALRRFDIVKNP